MKTAAGLGCSMAVWLAIVTTYFLVAVPILVQYGGWTVTLTLPPVVIVATIIAAVVDDLLVGRVVDRHVSRARSGGFPTGVTWEPPRSTKITVGIRFDQNFPDSLW